MESPSGISLTGGTNVGKESKLDEEWLLTPSMKSRGPSPDRLMSKEQEWRTSLELESNRRSSIESALLAERMKREAQEKDAERVKNLLNSDKLGMEDALRRMNLMTEGLPSISSTTSPLLASKIALPPTQTPTDILSAAESLKALLQVVDDLRQQMDTAHREVDHQRLEVSAARSRETKLMERIAELSNTISDRDRSIESLRQQMMEQMQQFREKINSLELDLEKERRERRTEHTEYEEIVATMKRSETRVFEDSPSPLLAVLEKERAGRLEDREEFRQKLATVMSERVDPRLVHVLEETVNGLKNHLKEAMATVEAVKLGRAQDADMYAAQLKELQIQQSAVLIRAQRPQSEEKGTQTYPQISENLTTPLPPTRDESFATKRFNDIESNVSMGTFGHSTFGGAGVASGAGVGGGNMSTLHRSSSSTSRPVLPATTGTCAYRSSPSRSSSLKASEPPNLLSTAHRNNSISSNENRTAYTNPSTDSIQNPINPPQNTNTNQTNRVYTSDNNSSYKPAPRSGSPTPSASLIENISRQVMMMETPHRVQPLSQSHTYAPNNNQSNSFTTPPPFSNSPQKDYTERTPNRISISIPNVPNFDSPRNVTSIYDLPPRKSVDELVREVLEKNCISTTILSMPPSSPLTPNTSSSLNYNYRPTSPSTLSDSSTASFVRRGAGARTRSPHTEFPKHRHVPSVPSSNWDLSHSPLRRRSMSPGLDGGR